ncbi:hypothetical protein J2Y74_003681 [Pseudomonas migulae]|uniref:hypothetical protein n=1 Tax=Pseudomonas migulae TaxID=78543 RepID=UPI00209E08E1|nr:hypothetical protein [Pseudomonas migulae]MCP1519371.1 hypothetical protein [Pseudomonas migulae]
MDINEILLAHTQYVAKFYQAYRGSLEKLIELIRYSIGEASPAPDRVKNFLLKESNRTILEQQYETALWRSSDRSKSWRLVCLATQTDPQVAARLLAKRPPSSDCCFFCWADERGVLDALIPELDIYGKPTTAYLHRQCMRPWKLHRDLVARAQTKTKESLI